MRRLVKVSLFIIAIFVALGIPYNWGLIHTAQVRLDTGDIRYCFFGVPYRRKPAAPQVRRKVEDLAASLRVEEEWVVCARFPRRSTGRPEVRTRIHYMEIAALAEEDRQVAKIVYRDLVRRLQGYSFEGHGQVPPEAILDNPGVFIGNADGGRSLAPNWRDDVIAQDYLRSNGLCPGD